MLKIIDLNGIDIFSQLKIEEYLLKTKDDSYCIINKKPNDSIVLGSSNKVEELVHTHNAKKDKIFIVKRFSGGGGVFLDNNSFLVSFIFSKDLLNIELYPEVIMNWSKIFYEKVFNVKEFDVKENDFVFNDKKIGGNAQYIRKNRFLLHTSFLFDFDIDKINKYLKHPGKAPSYRINRSHEDFITKISPVISKEVFYENLNKSLKSSFPCKKIDIANFVNSIENNFNYSTRQIII